MAASSGLPRPHRHPILLSKWCHCIQQPETKCKIKALIALQKQNRELLDKLKAIDAERKALEDKRKKPEMEKPKLYVKDRLLKAGQPPSQKRTPHHDHRTHKQQQTSTTPPLD